MYGEEDKKGTHKGGEIVRLEPHGMNVLNANPGYEEFFRKARCLRICQKMDGHHVGVSHLFVVNFEEGVSRAKDLIIPVTKLDISMATGIPVEGEQWFKGNYLDTSECKKLFAKGYEDTKLVVGAPRACLSKKDDELLKVIQWLFTCEGRFNFVYAYHMWLLMHFKGVKLLNIPLFFQRSLRKMENKVKKHSRNSSSHLFHCVVIHLLIVKELDKRKKTWGSFLEKLGYVKIPLIPLKVKIASPSGKRRSSKRTDGSKRGVKEETPKIDDTLEEVAAKTKRVRRSLGIAVIDSLKVGEIIGEMIWDKLPSKFQAKFTIIK